MPKITCRWLNWCCTNLSARIRKYGDVTLHDGRVVYSKGNDHVIDAVRCAMLAREQANLDLVGDETVSLKPVLTDPVFI